MPCYTYGMTKMMELAKRIEGVDLDSETCPVCNDSYMIECPEHMAETDEDGWCMTCESGEVKPQRISCPCQNIS